MWNRKNKPRHWKHSGRQPVLPGRLATSTSTAERDMLRHSWLGVVHTCSAQLRPHVRATRGFHGTIMWLADAFISAECQRETTQVPACSLAGYESPACADLSEAASVRKGG